MTALGNVMALVWELDHEGADAVEIPVPAARDARHFDLPPAVEDASSLGEVLLLIREMQGDSLKVLIDSLPPVPRRAAAGVAA